MTQCTAAVWSCLHVVVAMVAVPALVELYHTQSIESTLLCKVACGQTWVHFPRGVSSPRRGLAWLNQAKGGALIPPTLPCFDSHLCRLA
jgi:hypothetical protein